MNKQPDILFVMTDQQRFDTIAALGNGLIHTPNMDRLVRRGASFTHAYSTCPVCVPARYTVRTGCEPPTTRVFTNNPSPPAPGQASGMEERCGPYLARRMRQLGYRAFGIGKFHSEPWNEDLGYELQLHSEELYATPEQRAGDAYADWLRREHPAYDHLEMLMGERRQGTAFRPERRPGRTRQPGRDANGRDGPLAHASRHRLPSAGRARRAGGRRPENVSFPALGLEGRTRLSVRQLARHRRLSGQARSYYPKKSSDQ